MLVWYHPKKNANIKPPLFIIDSRIFGPDYPPRFQFQWGLGGNDPNKNAVIYHEIDPIIVAYMSYVKVTSWWFGTMEFYDFPIHVGMDCHQTNWRSHIVFFREVENGRSTNHQAVNPCYL
jgi:hypothetical protein